MALEQAKQASESTVAPYVVAFAASWIAAWNDHDLDRIGAHYSSDVTFWSPVAARLLPESKGFIQGRDSLLAYFALALSRNPDLHFNQLEALQGADGDIAIVYRNHRGVLVVETVHLEAGMISSAIAYYSIAV